jgi:hypothetical protein
MALWGISSPKMPATTKTTPSTWVGSRCKLKRLSWRKTEDLPCEDHAPPQKTRSHMLHECQKLADNCSTGYDQADSTQANSPETQWCSFQTSRPSGCQIRRLTRLHHGWAEHLHGTTATKLPEDLPCDDHEPRQSTRSHILLAECQKRSRKSRKGYDQAHGSPSYCHKIRW